MTTSSEVRGVWTYRSIANLPGVIDDFNKLKVWEAELSLEVEENGRIHGLLGERPDTATGSDPYLSVEGEITSATPVNIKWRAKGRPGSAYDGWIYDYIGFLTPEWPDATHPHPSIVGTVTRTVAHGNASAGSVFSFVAVKS